MFFDVKLLILMTHKKVENKNEPIADTEPSIITREKRTVEFMVQMYCNAKHDKKNGLCLECNEFLTYVKNRLESCPYQEKKTACGKCGLPCYEPQKKEKSLEVFTYAGPRMLFRHPILAIHHVLDSFKDPKKIDE